MKLRRLYSNRPAIFTPIEFNAGVSAVLAEIRVPENRDLDTHNLGKTTVGELVDYCLLKGKDPRFFLFKHAEFRPFIFFLEIEIHARQFLTVRRAVDPGSRVGFLRSDARVLDASGVPDDEWDQPDLPFERARTYLDGTLAFDALRPWPFRKLVGYLIRSQRDYNDVFQLRKFSGPHKDWKPFVAHLLGLEPEPVTELYEKKAALDEAKETLSTLLHEWGADDTDPSLLDGLIAVRRREAQSKEHALEAFNFGGEDSRTSADLVERVEQRLVDLNEERYRLTRSINRIDASLEEHKIAFDPTDAAKVFDEAGVLFAEQLTHDFEQLIRFNKAITQEREVALREQRREATARIEAIHEELLGLNEERAESLRFLRESDSLAKYRELTLELTEARTQLATLEAKRKAAARLVELRQERRTLEEEFGHLQTRVEQEIVEISRDESSRFALIRRFFTEALDEVLGENAVLAISVNSAGGIDFRAEFVNDSGVATSGDRGTSYRKLLCIAFDLAVLRAYRDVPFPRFLYLDGALEQLEPRKREKLIRVFRECAGEGLQPIISLLDSDLPEPLDTSPSTLSTADVVLTLHDEGEDGRLFRMPAW